jgi:hypothetical protein
MAILNEVQGRSIERHRAHMPAMLFARLSCLRESTQ